MNRHIAFWIVGLLLLVGSAQAQKIDNLPEVKCRSHNPIFSRLGKAYLAPTYEADAYWVWGGSVVQDDAGKYHLFVSRFPKALPFHPGWMVASEIVHCVANTPQGPYTFSEVALPARGAQYWDGRSTHNPRILRHKGKYYLIYMGSTHPFEEPTGEELTLTSKWCTVARSNKRIGLAVADTPYGPWRRMDRPILTTEPNTFYSYLTSNPSPVIQKDGSVMMMFKGRAYDGNSFSDMALGMAYAPAVEGPYTVLNDKQPVLNVKEQGEGEDPFLWQDKAGFHIIYKDQRGGITGEKGGGVLAHSRDGLTWVQDADKKAYSKTIEWEDNSIGRQGQLERPFILFEEGRPAYLFFATMDGPGEFENSTRSWNMVIPFIK